MHDRHTGEAFRPGQRPPGRDDATRDIRNGSLWRSRPVDVQLLWPELAAQGLPAIM